MTEESLGILIGDPNDPLMKERTRNCFPMAHLLEFRIPQGQSNRVSHVVGLMLEDGSVRSVASFDQGYYAQQFARYIHPSHKPVVLRVESVG